MKARSTTTVCAALGLILASRRAAAEPATNGKVARPDHFDLSVHGEMYGELFRRALLPGPSGSIVEADTVAPLYEYLSLRAQDIDAPWRPDSVDVELAA